MSCFKTICKTVVLCLPLGLGCVQQNEELAGVGGPRISPMTYLAAGNMLESQNDALAAIHQYKKAVQADQTLVRGYNRMAILYQRLKRHDEAQQILKEGLEANPESAVLRNNFGFCCMQKSNYTGAEQQFRSALALSPNFARARMNLAIILAKTDRPAESVKEFKTILPDEAAYCNVAAVCIEEEAYTDAEWALRNALAKNPDYAPAKEFLDFVTSLAQLSKEQTEGSCLELDWAAAACARENPGQVTIKPGNDGRDFPQLRPVRSPVNAMKASHPGRE